jgi:hypothetical protein
MWWSVAKQKSDKLERNDELIGSMQNAWTLFEEKVE